MHELLTNLDIVQHISIQRLRWLGHIVRIEKDAPAKRRSAEVGLRMNLFALEGPNRTEATGRMCQGRPKSLKEVLNGRLSKYNPGLNAILSPHS